MNLSTDEWFRSADWGEVGEGDFRLRLAKARAHNRAQYRRIKAHSLLATGDSLKAAGARRLLAEIVEGTDAPDFERVMALSVLGKLALNAGRIDEAEANLRQAVQLIENGASGGSDLEEAWLAEVLISRGGRESLREARALIERRLASPPLIVSAQFQVLLTATRVALEMNDRSAAAEWARAALDLADAEHTGLANHPHLGLAEVDAPTREWLRGVGFDR